MKQLEKHNLLDIVKKHNLVNFTKKDLVNIVNKYYVSMYYTYNIHNTLQDLVNDLKLNVIYKSEKIEPKYSCYVKINVNKFGSVSIPTYNISSEYRNKIIDNLIN